MGTYINKRIIWQGATADFLKYVLCAGRLVVESSGMSVKTDLGLPELPHSIGFLPARGGLGSPRLGSKGKTKAAEITLQKGC